MTPARYKELDRDMNACCTAEEVAAGWHWCCEWDGLLVGPTMPEWDCCLCYSPEQRKALETKP